MSTTATKTKRQTQSTRMLSYLRRRSINTVEAMEQLGIVRPAATINRLREQGFNIETRKDEWVNPYGETTTVARYFLSK